ncbi:MAG: DNA internalization-related competence protein ComEC/Rec2 [Candidatus Stygibacter frigidus]|nr:DNA internalization-related competence protein ComEC/Rec2 [Candidatus Stygibacter frigidus]
MIIRSAPCTLILPVLGWICGLVAGQFLELSATSLIAVISINIIALILSKYNNILLLILIFWLAFFRMDLADIRPADHLDNILKPSQKVETMLTGIIEREIRKDEFSGNYPVKVLNLDEHTATGNIYLKADNSFYAGDKIQGNVILEKPEGARNPGQPDKRYYYQLKGISGFAEVKTLMTRDSDHHPDIFYRLAHAIENRLNKRLGSAAPFALAITLGNTSATNWDFHKNIRRVGLSHLFAVSGLHVGIIALIIYSILISFFPYKAARISMIFMLLVYGFLCHWTPSVSRAIIMLGIYTLCQLLERPVNLNQILLLSLLLITLIAPYHLFSPGLQLSFAATLVIINLAPLIERQPFYRRLAMRNIMAGRIFQTLIFTTAVILFISPISLANFGSFSANGIICIIPASILFSLLLPLAFTLIILPWGWQPFAYSFKFLLYLFYKWLGISANLSFYVQNCKIALWQAGLIYLMLLIAAISYKNRAKIKALIFLLFIPCLILIPQLHFENKGEFMITCIDCGQGDLSFVELPSGEKLLIDTGPNDHQRGTADSSLLPWLSQRGISKLDYVIVTHAHDDHYGGLMAIFKALKVNSVITSVQFWQDINDIELNTAFAREKSQLITISDTTSIWLGNTRLLFLLPDSSFIANNQNNKSLVIKLMRGDFSALFTGDIEEEAEKWLLTNYYDLLDSDFMKAPHHGSISSNTVDFIQAVNPKVCFIPAGKNNRFRFPHQTVVQRYDFLNDHLVTAAYDGALVLHINATKTLCEIMLRDTTFTINN